MDGTSILNDADIYFDFNEPVITNQTLHTVNKWLNAYPVGIAQVPNSSEGFYSVYPNPTSGTIRIKQKEVSTLTEITVLNMPAHFLTKHVENSDFG